MRDQHRVCGQEEAGELTEEEREGYIYLLLCTVAGVSAGVQNTG